MATQQYISAYNNYTIQLWAIANGIDAMYPAERARVAAWESAARAAGVYEGNIIAVLGPFNVWEEIVTTLSGGTIPREIQRVQQGGAIPHEADWANNSGGTVAQGDLQPYRPPARITLPDIQTMLAGQGGALSGSAQYSAPLSVTVTRQDVAVPASVATSPNVVSTIAAQYPPPPPRTMDPPPGETATLPYPTAGISGPLPTAVSGQTGSGPATVRGDVGGFLEGPMIDFATSGGTATGEPDKRLFSVPNWLWGLAFIAVAYYLVKGRR